MHTREPPSITELWDLDGLSRVQMESATGIPWEHLTGMFDEACFQLSRSGRIEAGPCTECGRRVNAPARYAGHRCPRCAGRTSLGHDVIIGDVNLTRERQARDERAERRARAGLDGPKRPERIPTGVVVGRRRPR